MLEGLKRWIAGSPSAATQADLEALKAWAEARQFLWRKPREGEGAIVEGKQGQVAWRLEWGAPQRSYVPGAELRIRAELGLPSDLQVMLLNKPLQEAMEKAVFEQYVEGVQTRMDNQTPPEMRWLVMLPRLSGSAMGRLRERWAAVTSAKPWVLAWLEGALGSALAALRTDPATPLVLTIARGRLTLRTAMPEAEPRDIEPLLRLFETAIREVMRLSAPGGAASAADAER